MTKKFYKEKSLIGKANIKPDDDRRTIESKLKKQFTTYLDIFQWMFLELYMSDLNLSSSGKKRNWAAITIKKKYNIHILIALWLLKILIPYFNIRQHPKKKIMNLSDRELIIIRWVAVGYNFFIDINKFIWFCSINPELQNLPPEYEKVVSWIDRGADKNNFNKYMRNIDKHLFIKSIDYFCGKLDKLELTWSLGEFLWYAIFDFLRDIEISQQELWEKSIGIEIKKSRQRMILKEILSDRIFLWTKWERSRKKTRRWFWKRFKEKIEEKITYWK